MRHSLLISIILTGLVGCKARSNSSGSSSLHTSQADQLPVMVDPNYPATTLEGWVLQNSKFQGKDLLTFFPVADAGAAPLYFLMLPPVATAEAASEHCASVQAGGPWKLPQSFHAMFLFMAGGRINPVDLSSLGRNDFRRAVLWTDRSDQANPIPAVQDLVFTDNINIAPVPTTTITAEINQAMPKLSGQNKAVIQRVKATLDGKSFQVICTR